MPKERPCLPRTLGKHESHCAEELLLELLLLKLRLLDLIVNRHHLLLSHELLSDGRRSCCTGNMTRERTCKMPCGGAG